MKLLKLMALVPSILMNIGIVQADFVHSLEVVSSWELLTDTATIKLPRKIKGVNGRTLKELVKADEAVIIDAGYDGNLDRIFEGAVLQVNPTIPFVIECQDPMKALKENNFTMAWKNATLAQVLDHIAPNIEKQLLDVELGKFQFERVSGARVLDALKKRGLYSFFRNGKLQVGLQYNPETAKRHVFSFGHNIHKDGNNLEFFSKENIRLKVKAISIGTDNKKTIVEIGDETGDQRTMHFYNLSATELKAAAERELDRLKYDGYRGSFKTFGQPTVQHGDIVKVIDPFYEDRAGEFWVDKVVRSYSLGGYNQVITLGAAI